MTLGKRGEHLGPNPHKVTGISVGYPHASVVYQHTQSHRWPCIYWCSGLTSCTGALQPGLLQLILVLQPISVNCTGPAVSVQPPYAISIVWRGKMLHIPSLLPYPVSFLQSSFKTWWQSLKLAFFVLVKTSQGYLSLTPKVICLKGFSINMSLFPSLNFLEPFFTFSLCSWFLNCKKKRG